LVARREVVLREDRRREIHGDGVERVDSAGSDSEVGGSVDNNRDGFRLVLGGDVLNGSSAHPREGSISGLEVV